MIPLDDENIKKLGEKLKELAEKHAAKERKNLKPTSHLPTISELIAEGEKLLAEDLRVKKALANVPEKAPKTDIPPSSTNPYIQARHQILSKYSEWRRNEIAEMEKTGNTDNRHYTDFTHDVMVLGDKLSNKS